MLEAAAAVVVEVQVSEDEIRVDVGVWVELEVSSPTDVAMGEAEDEDRHELVVGLQLSRLSLTDERTAASGVQRDSRLLRVSLICGELGSSNDKHEMIVTNSGWQHASKKSFLAP